MTNAQESLLNELLDDESDRLTAWEQEFLDSLDGQRNMDRWELTDKQDDSLQGIAKKIGLIE